MPSLVDQIQASKDGNPYRPGETEQERNKRNMWDNFLPPLLKKAYNDSITGMVHQMMTGKKRFDLPMYEPGLVKDLGAAILSFLMPIDALSVVVPGGLAFKGATAGKAAMRTSKILQNNGIEKKVANKIAKDIAESGSVAAASLGTYEGLYEAMEEGRKEIISKGIPLSKFKEMDRDKILEKMVTKGSLAFGKGAFMGQTLGLARATRFTKLYGGKYNPLKGLQGTKEAGFVNEALAFGAVSPVLYEGRAPTFQDFAMAGAIIGGLNIAPKVLAAPFNIGKRARANVEAAKKKAREEIENMDPEMAQKLGFTDKNAVNQFLGSAMLDDALKYTSNSQSILGTDKVENVNRLTRMILQEAHRHNPIKFIKGRHKKGWAKVEHAKRESIDSEYKAYGGKVKPAFFKGEKFKHIDDANAIYVTKVRRQGQTIDPITGIKKEIYDVDWLKKKAREEASPDRGMFRLGDDAPSFYQASENGKEIYLTLGEPGVIYHLDKTNTKKWWMYHTSREDIYQKAKKNSAERLGKPITEIELSFDKSRNAILKDTVEEAYSNPDIYGPNAVRNALAALEAMPYMTKPANTKTGKRGQLRELFDVKQAEGSTPSVFDEKKIVDDWVSLVVNPETVAKKAHHLNPTQKELLIHHLENQRHYFSDLKIMDDALAKSMWSGSAANSQVRGPLSQFFSGFRTSLENVEHPASKWVLTMWDLIDGSQNALAGYYGNKIRNSMHFTTFYRKESRHFDKNWRRYVDGEEGGKYTKSSLAQDMRNKNFEKDILEEQLAASGMSAYEIARQMDKLGHKGYRSGSGISANKVKAKTGKRDNKRLEFAQRRKMAVAGIKGVLDDMWGYSVKTLGKANLAKKEDFYFPVRLNKEIFKFIGDADTAITKDLVKVNHRLEHATSAAGLEIDLGRKGITKIDEGERAKVESILIDFLNVLRTNVQAKIKKKGINSLSRNDQLAIGYTTLFESVERQLRKIDPNVSYYDVFFALRQGSWNYTFKPMMAIERKKTKLKRAFEMIDIGKAARDAVVPEEFIRAGITNLYKILEERSAMVLLNDYVNQHAQRMMQAKYLGRNAEKLNAALKRIPASKRLEGSAKMPEALGGLEFDMMMPTKERDAMIMISDIMTNKMHMYSANSVAEVLSKVNNLEMAFKINSGFAALLNITQTFISTAQAAGFWRSMSAAHKAILPEAAGGMSRTRRDEINAVTNNLHLLDEVFGGNTGLDIAANQYRRESTGVVGSFIDSILGKSGDRIGSFVNWTGEVSQFNRINRINSLIAGVAAEKLLIDMAHIARGIEKGAWGKAMSTIAPNVRKAWAIDKLRAMGVNINSQNSRSIMHFKGGKFQNSVEGWMKNNSEEVLRLMHKFSVDTQLKRSFTRDPLMFNNPNIKPMLIFKRFAYRQPEMQYKLLRREWLNGNVVPVLSLGVAGLAGGQFVLWAREMINQVLSGEDYFSTRNKRAKFLKEGVGDLTFDKYLNGLSSVGAMGMVGELISDEEPMNAVSFFLKPVILDDMMKMGRAMYSFNKSMETHYGSETGIDAPLRSALRPVRSVVGGYPGRLLMRAETEKQRKDRVRQMKRNAIVAAKDSIMGGNGSEAAKVVNEFNAAWGPKYPSLIIKSEDFNIKAIMKDYNDKIIRRREEYQYIP